VALPSWFVLVLLLIMAMQSPATGVELQSAQPIPAGRTAANNATRQAEKVEPPTAVARGASAADLQKQSDELLSLAQQVHTDTQRASHGVVDKDLKDRLKRIEKLSKKLRDELGL
jgi:hypothetical protein